MNLDELTKKENDAPAESVAPKRRRISTRKKLVYSLVTVFIFFLGAEIACRVGACVVYGFSPYYLFYGWERWMADTDPDGHSAMGAGYFKFHPNQTVKEYGMFARPTSIRINNMGFRGQDFDANKANDVFRIICLGGSSTFGFFGRDNFTYPALLQQRFSKGSRMVEVINVGVPHAKSQNLLALFREELLGYSPDLITIYSGYNDATYYMDANLLQRMGRWLHGHSATYVAVKNGLEAVGGPVLHSKWRKFAPNTGHEEAAKQIRLHNENYKNNIGQLISLAEEAGIRVVLILQPVDFVDGEKYRHGTHGKGAPYWNEVADVRQKYDNHEPLSKLEVSLLVHSDLMDVLRSLASAEGRSLVDNISILDANPKFFASYVHLTEEGNAALADALYGEVTRQLDE